jgi:hypothetical protein
LGASLCTWSETKSIEWSAAATGATIVLYWALWQWRKRAIDRKVVHDMRPYVQKWQDHPGHTALELAEVAETQDPEVARHLYRRCEDYRATG